MAYIDNTYYKNIFKGSVIPSEEFDRLADIASDIIDLTAVISIDSTAALLPEVKKACAYEVELLHQHGGIDAITGLAASINGQSESLGGYSYNGSGTVITNNGIPISAMSVAMLRKAGLMNRCVRN